VIEIQNPPSFLVREEAHKAAYEHGFRIEVEPDTIFALAYPGWLGYASTTVRGQLWFARETTPHGLGGRWLLALTHAGVAEELWSELDKYAAYEQVEVLTGPEMSWHGSIINTPGVMALALPSLSTLYHILTRVYKLSISLPDAPLDQFRKRTATLPRTTEAERLTVQRVGQDIFRDALLEYWNGRCPLTGITDPALLRASHIVRWAECETDAQRLDVHNGLLLSALWDAAFDAGLISFDDAGYILRSSSLTQEAAAALTIDTVKPIILTNLHSQNLAKHRVRYGY
jgi:HNH endonuclease